MIYPADSLSTCTDRMLDALRSAIYADAALAGWPCVMRFDALAVDGPYIGISFAPDPASVIVGEDGSFVCTEGDLTVRVCIDADDPAVDTFPAARASVGRTLNDTASLVEAGVARVIQFHGETGAGVDSSRLVAEFTARALVCATSSEE